MARTKKEEYSEIKKLIWRYGRVFVDGLLGALTVSVLQKAIDMQYDEGVKFLVAAALAGGFAALSKALRARSDSYDDKIHKLPL